jgi:hypothetical protein
MTDETTTEDAARVATPSTETPTPASSATETVEVSAVEPATGFLGEVGGFLKEEVGHGVHVKISSGTGGNFLLEFRNGDSATIEPVELGNFLVDYLGKHL